MHTALAAVKYCFVSMGENECEAPFGKAKTFPATQGQVPFAVRDKLPLITSDYLTFHPARGPVHPWVGVERASGRSPHHER